MNTSTLLTTLRFRLDYNSYSNYQITEALNYVLKEINLALNGITSSLTVSSATLPLTDNQADLPSDLESIVQVVDKINISVTEELDGFSYQIAGNKIMAQGDAVTLYYRKMFPVYEYDTAITPETIELPSSFDNPIIDNIVALLTGQPLTIKDQVIKLIANRDGKKRSQRLIFRL